MILLAPGDKVRLTERGKLYFPVANVKREGGTVLNRHRDNPKLWRVRWPGIVAGRVPAREPDREDRMNAQIAFLVAALLAAEPALAQSTCRYIVPAATMTAAQWNECFASKADFAPPALPPPREEPRRIECSPYAGAWPSERRLCR